MRAAHRAERCARRPLHAAGRAHHGAGPGLGGRGLRRGRLGGRHAALRRLRLIGERGRALLLHIREYLVGTLLICIRSYALIMSITFLELSIGLTLIGVEHSIPTALCIALFDILPVLGTGGIMIPWTVISLLQGRYALGVGLAVVYLAVTVIRNILEPKIVGGQLGLHPVVTLAGMFIGAQLFGIIGLLECRSLSRCSATSTSPGISACSGKRPHPERPHVPAPKGRTSRRPPQG